MTLLLPVLILCATGLTQERPAAVAMVLTGGTLIVLLLYGLFLRRHSRR